MPQRLDGKAVAQKIYEDLLLRIEDLRIDGVIPCLAAILIGDNPSSRLYVQNKKQACERMGLRSVVYEFPASVDESAVLATIEQLNRDPEIHGVLVQLPLPAHIDRLLENRAVIIPCTPAGILYMLDTYGIPIEGRHCVVVGRSDIVGKPTAILFLHRHATVTICHSRTRNLPEIVRSAEILVVAIGRAAYIQPDWVHPDAVIIDVGINPVRDADVLRGLVTEDHPKWQAFQRLGQVILGDVHPLAYERARAYTPVPGGVGPLTVAMLVHNTVVAAEIQARGRAG